MVPQALRATKAAIWKRVDKKMPGGEPCLRSKADVEKRGKQKPRRGAGGRKRETGRDSEMQRKERDEAVSETTIRESEAHSWEWVEASIWTDRMLAALDNGVKGGKWYSLMDKVQASRTLKLAWERVRANQGGGSLPSAGFRWARANAISSRERWGLGVAVGFQRIRPLHFL
ncbi:hypothetical protein CCP3SC15_250014 [Gammaproteobacteria bacterium]